MPRVWLSLKKSLHCKSDRQEVEVPQSTRDASSSRSLANHLKDVFLGSKRGIRNGNCSPCSIASTEFLHNNNMLEEAMILRDYSGFEKKNIVGSFRECKSSDVSKANARGTRNHGDVLLSPSKQKKNQQSVGLNGKIATKIIPGCKVHAAVNEVCTCLKYCSQRYTNIQSLQRYNLRSYAVSVLKEGDSTRNVVEIIFKSSWLESKVECCQIERVLKVNHTHNTLAKFEEYRDTVRATASKLAKKHQRCMADGNEVLSFHGTTITCSLGIDGLSTPCNFLDCNVCNIITTGFPSKQSKGKGIYTAATSLRAHNSITLSHDGLMYPVKRAMMVCRVIAGRVHKPPSTGSVDKFSIPVGFDSVAGEVESCSKLEELYISSPRGILPCFIVIYS
ncbi:hypothetical protein SUGI_0962990 [Cryptomeria japonica]|uniref:uncharacterized protein LOC131042822 n=1 Tax=Cryptomeria japonica TaxID=3369 RepID=UPI0024147675|nr:uncharacterized protein LOC131042822 [Cryptomeria japonica]GLJ45762.1 hypothetical protein SUGI_0962990 [Cryptomeria japonica]